ncbi:MAG: hypothetical protein ACD_36C00113G0003 [uncultured bacterium]|uniref:Lipid II isoglutaminyl synthase (glutamine-hydrolyzing) subunit MurT n=1 Tax=Candidatus Gottesmanbacteria bacterium RIFCSPLOWO2_01_FULL_43_11b TaxID=1798392 RepID=A0A1F6AIY8_9BACT|nr:MAG: hypothetical protein ACD_36C00113G0003 [uncultured bacterium]OGG24606.1 MAG: hypothetical protein A3A79_05500 [Candidatus Gottesmanbacteria bacterium RIFCSPLOWO2_01_FULL_43_11b]
MSLWVRLIIALGKLVSYISQSLHFGAGATWPGEIALMLRPNIASELIKNLKKGVILVAGTNGKTTTSLMIKQILEQQGLTIVHNASGANLLNGIVSVLIQKSQADWGVFEVDENSLPVVTEQLTTNNKQLMQVIVLLNLFRDQLDRYGEVDVIVEKWQKVLKTGSFVLNADDPAIAYLGKNLTHVTYFGVNDKKHFLKNVEHATDSTFCLNCGGRLTYEGIYYSHIGIWRCERCGFRRPKPDVFEVTSPLPGLYNQYNTLAAVAAVKALGIHNPDISDFMPAFGRQEEFEFDGKQVKIFLSKNPAGFNASLRTVLEQGANNLLLILNDRIPDGRDVSWIWDVDFEMISKNTKIFVSGDRVYDLALRLQYAEKKPIVISSVYEALSKSETLYILPTYSAMLDVRNTLLGRKIL